MASHFQNQSYNPQGQHGNQGPPFHQPLNNLGGQEMYENQTQPRQPQYNNQRPNNQPPHEPYVEMKPQGQPHFGLIEQQQPQGSVQGSSAQQYANPGPQQPLYNNQGPPQTHQGAQQPQYGNQVPPQAQYGNSGPNGQQPPYHNQNPGYNIQGGTGQQSQYVNPQPKYTNQGSNEHQQPQYGNQQSGSNFPQTQGTMPQKSQSGSQQTPPPIPRPRQKSLPRSISSTNVESTSRCRNIVQQDWVMLAPQGGTNFFATVPAFTLTLPSLDRYPADFQQFVFDRLIDKYTQSNLQNDKCLNWCRSATQLVPLYTTGDGNCLLHAASLAMWGFQDRDFTLRKAMYNALQNHANTQLRRRWKFSREKENEQMGIQLEPGQWEREWQMVISQASPEPVQGMPLESLEDFHIFVLANVLRRPIVMYAAPKLRSQATGGTLQHINFHGIYLPLLWEPNSCKKDPLPLAYYGGHFVALVAIEYRMESSQGKYSLPLTDYHGQLLPVRFALRMEEQVPLIMDYLYTTKIPCTGEPYITTKSVLGAQMSIATRPAYLEPLLTGFIEACWQAHFGNFSSQPRPQPLPNSECQPPSSDSRQSQALGSQSAAPTLSATSGERLKCINNCGAYGDPDKAGLCSQCYRRYREENPEQTDEGMFFSKQSLPKNEASILHPKCINNCGRRGLSDNGGLCSQCYERHRGQQVGQQQPFRPNVQTTSATGGQKCINDCGAYAEPNSPIGMCSRCTQKETQAASANEGNDPRNELNAPPPQASNGGGASLNSGSIKCPKCANPGHPSYLGMCEACYQGRSLGNEVATGKDHIYEAIPGPPNEQKPMMTQDPEVRKNCPTPNCEFFGTAQTLFYCSKCFERDMERILKEADSRPAQNYFPDQTAGQSRAPPSKSSGFQQRVDVLQQPQQRDPLPKPKPANDLCPQCKTYYTNPEYGGVCSACFFEKTKTESSSRETFVQNPVYNPCQTRGCRNLAEADGYCNMCRSSQSLHQRTAPVYQQQYSICSTINCKGMPTGNGLCDNCNRGFNRPSYAATQQHPSSAPSTNAPPVPKPRRHVPNPGGNSTAPIANLSSQMGGMSVSGNNIANCFMCTGWNDGSNVLCRQHAEEVKKTLPAALQSVRPESRGQPQGQRNQTDFYPQPAQGAPNQARSSFSAHNQASGFPPQQPHYGNTGQEPRRSPPPHSRASYNPQAQFGVDLSQAQHQQPIPPQQPPITNPNPQYGNTHSQGSSSNLQFGVNMPAPQQQPNMAAGAATGSSVGGGGGGNGPALKQLCAVAGCSYKGYRELNHLCPDCYETSTQLKAPEKYPLV